MVINVEMCLVWKCDKFEKLWEYSLGLHYERDQIEIAIDGRKALEREILLAVLTSPFFSASMGDWQPDL